MKLDGIVGDRSRLPFSVILSLRSQLGERRTLTALTILAFAASVGLAASVEMATRSVHAALTRTADAITGAAQIEIGGGDTGVPESLLEVLRAVPGVVAASPMIEETFRIEAGPHQDEPLRVIGIDLLYEHEVRTYHVEQGGFAVRDPLRLVAVPNSVVISEALAERLSLSEGDPLVLRSASGRRDMVVRGLLRGSLSDAYGGQFALMDVFGLQEVIGLGPRFHRIDVAVAPGEGVDAAVERIRAAIGDAAPVRTSELREIYVDSIMETLSVAVWTLAMIGILLSLFLTYAVTSLSVDRRLEEISLLRAAGMQGRSVALLILTDAALLAAFGTAIGFAASVYLGNGLVSVMSRASQYLQLIEIAPLELRGSTVAVALGVGVPVALVAALEPALRAGRRSPVDVLRGYRIPPSTSAINRPLSAFALGTAALGLSAWLAPELFGDSARLVLVIGCGVIAVGAGASQLLLLVFPQLQRLLGACIPRVGYLVGSSMLERPIELGATVAVWAAVSAALIAGTSMVRSVVVSWDEFNVGLNGEDAILVFSQDPLRTRHRELIRRDTIERVRQAPGVRGVAEYYQARTMFRGEEISLESRATRALAANSAVRALSDDPARTLAALQRGELAMNPAFARHFGVRVGDVLTLATSHGPVPFRVGATAHGFAGPKGELYLDVDTMLRHFDPQGAVEMTIWVDEPIEETLRDIQRAVLEQTLFFRVGEKFHKHTELVVAKFNDLLMVPVGLIAAIGLITLLNLLFGNVMARRRDLAILRGSGATRGNLRALVVLNAVFVGALGIAAGILLGAAWSRVATDLLADALGFRLRHVLYLDAVLIVSGAAAAMAILAGLASALTERDQVPRSISSLS